jgi:hypothetical protein
MSRVVLVLFVFFGIAFAVSAQQKQGRISGRVTDPDDIIVYQADVQVTNLDTKAAVPQKTDTTGSFWVESLPAGNYEISVQAPGFESYKSGKIALAAGQELVRDVPLKRTGKKD